jgi:hypothetical protein
MISEDRLDCLNVLLDVFELRDLVLRVFKNLEHLVQILPSVVENFRRDA